MQTHMQPSFHFSSSVPHMPAKVGVVLGKACTPVHTNTLGTHTSPHLTYHMSCVTWAQGDLDDGGITGDSMCRQAQVASTAMAVASLPDGPRVVVQSPVVGEVWMCGRMGGMIGMRVTG
eukprot:352807-Chlamydomonas_euryale.AAC.7